MEAAGTLLTVVVIVSFPLYAAFVVALVSYRRRPPFNSAFFSLCFSVSVADSLQLIHTQLFWKAPKMGYLTVLLTDYSIGLLPTYVLASVFHLGYVQHIGR